jgi:hypothetical protein
MKVAPLGSEHVRGPRGRLEKYHTYAEEYRRFRAEAEEVLRIKKESK